MTYKEALETKKPFRPVGMSRWFENSLDIKEYLVGLVDKGQDSSSACFELCGHVMRFMSNQFEVKSVSKVVWHIVLHEKDDNRKQTLIAYENEEQARHAAMRFVNSGVWLVSLYRSVEADE